MADTATITASQLGAYEIALPANTVTTVGVVDTGSATGGNVTVMVHSGSSPVYARNGSTVAVQDQNSTVIPVSSFASITRGSASQVALISASAAVVSVFRS